MGVRLSPAAIPTAGEQVLIERMMEGAVAELIVGIQRDEQFGLALVLGSGGVLANLVADSRTLLLPTDRDTVNATLADLKIDRLLQGYRGQPPGDRAAAVAAVLRLAAFAEQHRDRLVELDINPLLVLPQGQGAVAADALIRMAVD